MAKLVSVVMPVLNAAEWLDQAVDSILAQTHSELELIVVDDGSSDDSPGIAAHAAARDGRVRTLFLEPDPGLTSSSRAANAGIALAGGSYIARMDADDVALPHRLERQIAFLEARNLDACGGRAQGFGAKDGLFRFPESGEAIARELIFRVGILHPTLLARAELMREHPYLVNASHDDYEWQVRVAAAGARFGNLQEIVLRHRLHAQQANVRHAPLFMRDLRQYRFHHIMRLVPGISPDDYQILAAVAERAVLDDRGELEIAGNWLVRLTCRDEDEHCWLMMRRWEKVCDRAGLGENDALWQHVAEQLGPAAS